MADIDLQDVHDFLISTAKKAGEMITSARPKTGGAGNKKNSVDLVTETDQAVEKMVSTSLRERYPDFEYASLNPPYLRRSSHRQVHGRRNLQARRQAE